MEHINKTSTLTNVQLIIMGDEPPIACNLLGIPQMGIINGIDGESYYSPSLFKAENQPELMHRIISDIKRCSSPKLLSKLSDHVLKSLINSAYEITKITNVLELAKRHPELPWFTDCKNRNEKVDEGKVIHKMQGNPDHTEQCFLEVRKQLLLTQSDAAFILKECREVANNAAYNYTKDLCNIFFGNDEGHLMFKSIFPNAWNSNTFGSAARILSKKLNDIELNDFDKVLSRYILTEANQPNTNVIAEFFSKKLEIAQDVNLLATRIKEVEKRLINHHLDQNVSKNKQSLLAMLETHLSELEAAHIANIPFTIIVAKDQALVDIILSKPWLVYNKHGKNKIFYDPRTRTLITSMDQFKENVKSIAKLLAKSSEIIQPLPSLDEKTREKYENAIKTAKIADSIINIDINEAIFSPPSAHIKRKVSVSVAMLKHLASIPDIISKASKNKEMAKLTSQLTSLQKYLTSKMLHREVIETVLVDIVNNYKDQLNELQAAQTLGACSYLLENLNAPNSLEKASKVAKK